MYAKILCHSHSLERGFKNLTLLHSLRHDSPHIRVVILCDKVNLDEVQELQR